MLEWEPGNGVSRRNFLHMCCYCTAGVCSLPQPSSGDWDKLLHLMYVFLAYLPLYLMEAQGFSLAKMGIAASFLWAALCVAIFFTGYVSEKLVSPDTGRGLCSVP